MLFKVSKHIIKTVLWISSAVMACLMLTSAYGGHMNPNEHRSLFAVMTLALPIVASATLIFALAVLALKQWKIALIPAAAMLVSLPSLISIFPMTIFSRHAENQQNTFKVISFNAQSFRMDPDNTTTDENINMRFLLDQDADVVLLQEGSAADTSYLDLPSVLPLKAEVERKYPYHSKGYHDLSIMSKYPYKVIADTTLRQSYTISGNAYNEYHFYAKVFDLEIMGKPLRIINLHLQSILLSKDDKKLFLDLTDTGTTMNDRRQDLRKAKTSLIDKLSAAFKRRSLEAQKVRDIIDVSPENVIVCGDFNDTPASFSYRTIMGNDLNDAYVQCAFLPTYTYHDNRFYFKIDQILYRGSMRALTCKRLKEGNSDHYPLVATFEWVGAK